MNSERFAVLASVPVVSTHRPYEESNVSTPRIRYTRQTRVSAVPSSMEVRREVEPDSCRNGPMKRALESSGLGRIASDSRRFKRFPVTETGRPHANVLDFDYDTNLDAHRDGRGRHGATGRGPPGRSAVATLVFR